MLTLLFYKSYSSLLVKGSSNYKLFSSFLIGIKTYSSWFLGSSTIKILVYEYSKS
jgi:hypothetical protein